MSKSKILNSILGALMLAILLGPAAAQTGNNKAIDGAGAESQENAGALLPVQVETTPRLDVPFVPTPQPVVDKMLDLAKVGKNDVVYDLGSGDGRMVITAAKERGATGVGIDLDPKRVAEARANAKEAGVEDKVTFMVGDLFKTDMSKATVVTLYLLNSVNRELRPQLWRQLKVGTRVVSHAFDMGDEWPPEKVEEVNGSTIYYWTITEKQKKAVS